MRDFVTLHVEFYRNVYRYRSLIFDLARRDLLARYRGSSLGFLWSFLNPLLLMSIYAVVFRYISRFSIEDYPLYVLIGVLVWQCLSGSISEAATAIQSSYGLVTKTPLPAEVIPVKVVLSQMLNFTLSFVVFALFSLLFFGRVSALWLWFPVFWLLLAGFLIGVAVPVAMISAIYKDFQQLVSNLLTVLFFTTPVVYDYAALPEKIQTVLVLHPMAQIVRVAQHIFFYDKWPTPVMLVSIAAYIVLLETLAVYVCSRFRESVAEKV